MAEGIAALARRGHSNHVVLPSEGMLRSELGPADGVHICHHNPWVTYQHGAVLTARWLAYDIAYSVPAIFRTAKRVKADVIISNTICVLAGALAARRSIPHAWFLHEFGNRDDGLHFLFGERLTYRVIDRSSSVLLVHSEAMARYIADRTRPEKIRLVGNAVELRGERGPVSTTSGGALRVVVVGRLTFSKGQHDAITAIGHLAQRGVDVHLDIVGSGDASYERELTALVRMHGIEDRVRFKGFCAEPAAAIAQADALLMCSRCETFGRVTVEAMKLGKPVIGAAAGGTLELVRDGWNGLLYPFGAPEKLAQHIATLDRDRARTVLMGSRARTWAQERFGLDSYGAKLEAALFEAARRRSNTVATHSTLGDRA